MRALKFAATFALCNLLSLSYAQAASNDIQFDLMHTKLGCKYVGYQPTFCEMVNDSQEMDDSSQMVSKINAQLDRALKKPTASQVFIAYFSFSNKKVHSKLCELLKNGVAVRIFLDRGSAANIDILKTNPACAGVDFDSTSPFVRLYICPSTPIITSPLRHVKYSRVPSIWGEPVITAPASSKSSSSSVAGILSVKSLRSVTPFFDFLSSITSLALVRLHSARGLERSSPIETLRPVVILINTSSVGLAVPDSSSAIVARFTPEICAK